MALTVALWRTGRRRRPVPAVVPEPAEPELAAGPEPVRFPGTAAATNDRFLDAVVLISVVLFLVLAAGVGVLVLSSTGLFDQLLNR